MKKYLIIFITLIFSVLLVACGGDRGAPQVKVVEWYELPEDADYDGSKVTIKFWHRMGGANQTIIQNWIEEFEALYPNITVDEEKAADDYDKLADKIALAIPGGNAPHIAESYPDHVMRYGRAALALNYFVDNPNIGYTDEEIKDFLSGLWAEGTSYDNAGSIMSLPFTKSSEALFYNKTYFDEHGYELPERGYWTWDEIFAIAEDIKEREPDSYPLGYDSSDNMFITMSEQWDAPYTGYDSNGLGAVLFNNNKSKEMVKYFKDKVDKELMITRALNAGAYTSDVMKTGNKLYMFVGSTGGARYSIEGVKTEVFNAGYRVGVAPVPVKDVNNRKQIQQGPNLSLFKKDNEQEMIASWLFVKFMLEAEKTAEFALQSGYAPVRHSAYETDIWTNYVKGVKENPTTPAQAGAKIIKEAIEMFRDNEDIFFTSAVFNLSSKARSEVGSLLNKIFAYKGSNLDKFIDDEYLDSFEFVND
ncbi:MAG: extracellular solute-binding protein [Acholeplasmataceae bacterium]